MDTATIYNLSECRRRRQGVCSQGETNGITLIDGDFLNTLRLPIHVERLQVFTDLAVCAPSCQEPIDVEALELSEPNAALSRQISPCKWTIKASLQLYQ